MQLIFTKEKRNYYRILSLFLFRLLLILSFDRSGNFYNKPFKCAVEMLRVHQHPRRNTLYDGLTRPHKDAERNYVLEGHLRSIV